MARLYIIMVPMLCTRKFIQYNKHNITISITNLFCFPYSHVIQHPAPVKAVIHKPVVPVVVKPVVPLVPVHHAHPAVIAHH